MKRLILTIASALLATELAAHDLYVVRFTALGKTLGCRQALWGADVELYNYGSVPATVSLLGVSNGTLLPGTPTTMELPPNKLLSVSLNGPGWIPDLPVPTGNVAYKLWSLHLDVPENVSVTNVESVADQDICVLSPLGTVVSAPVPTFTALVPANVPQVKLATSIGSLPARENVIIFNAADVTANAVIEVRRSCDDAVVDQRVITVPANTTLQVGGLATGSSDVSCLPFTVDRFDRYTVIRVDQPSFSIVSILTENRPSTDVVPLLGLVVR